MAWYDEKMPEQDDGYERFYYPERFSYKPEEHIPKKEDYYDIMYRNLREGKNADGSEVQEKIIIEADTIWMHHNGLIYQVLHIANQESTNPDYPETVVYKGANGKVWAKVKDNFLAKMSKIDHKRNLK